MKQFPVQPLPLLDSYAEILLKWNKKINLTAYTRGELYSVGFFDCSVLAVLLGFLKIKRLVDVGTGYGMPGLVLKMLKPEIDVTLLDSSEKKIAFLRYVSTILKIPVLIVLSRLPDPVLKITAEGVVSKASMKENALLNNTRELIQIGGFLAYFSSVTTPVHDETLPVIGAITYKRPDGSVSRIIVRRKHAHSDNC